MNRVKMKMLALAYNTLSKTGAYALILTDGDDALRVPVIIGMPEAQSIAAAISKSETRRPTTHDMVRTLLGRLGVTLEEINIYGFQAGIFHAEALFRHPGGESLRLDVRASDGVALALRFGCPIYMAGDVLAETGIPTAVFEANWLQRADAAPAGNAPAELSEEELNRLMEEAVEKEDYETASRYRDMLKAKKDK